MIKDSYRTTSDLQTQKLGEEFAKQLKTTDVVYLNGKLGSGKTTFVKGIAKGLGIESRILSPTFVVARTHSVSSRNIKTLYHLDLYRLDKTQEVEEINIKDYLDDPGGVVIIEWPEVGKRLVNKKVWWVTFGIVGDETRTIMFAFK